MKSSINPFSFLRETIRFPFSRIQRTTLWQKVADAFMVTFGMYDRIYSSYPGMYSRPDEETMGAPKHWGIFDYLTLGVPKFLFYILNGILIRTGLFLNKIPAAAGLIFIIFEVILLLPLIIPFGCLWLARYVVSALLPFLALPFIALIHSVVGRTLRQKIFEPILNQPQTPTLPEPKRNSDEWKALKKEARQSNKALETLLPNSSLNEIKIALDSLRRKSKKSFDEYEQYEAEQGLYFYQTQYSLTLLINGNTAGPSTPPPTIERISPNQAPLYFAVNIGFYRLWPDDCLEARRHYSWDGTCTEKEAQTNVHSPDKELLSLLETAIRLNVGHIATRFEKNGTLDLVLSYIESMLEPNLIPVSVLPKEVVENVVLSYI
jgi:hypothetical protein